MYPIKLYTQLVIHLNKYLKGEKRLDLIFTELMIYFILFSNSPPLLTQQLVIQKYLKGEKKIKFQYISFYFPTPLPC